MSSTEPDTATDLERRASRLADDLRRAVAEGRAQEIDATVVRQLFAASVRAFVSTLEAGTGTQAFEGCDGVTATEAAVTAERLLEAADLNPFELTMWNRLGRL